MCDFPGYGVYSEPATAEEYFHSIRVLQRRSREQWKVMLHNVQQKLGAPTDFTLTTWNAAEKFVPGASGLRRAGVQDDVRARHQRRDVHALRPRGSDDVTIVGHDIRSLGLLQ